MKYILSTCILFSLITLYTCLGWQVSSSPFESYSYPHDIPVQLLPAVVFFSCKRLGKRWATATPVLCYGVRAVQWE